VGLFKKYILKFLCIYLCFTFLFGEEKISEISYIDYTFLNNKESQFNLGYRSGGYYSYSIDKFISDNLIGSAKVSVIDLDHFDLLNQLTFKFLNKKYPLSIFLGYNYFSTDSKSFSWINFSLAVEFIYKNKYLSAFGLSNNISKFDFFDGRVRYFCELRRILSNDTSLSFGFNFNPKNLIVNKTIELNIEI